MPAQTVVPQAHTGLGLDAGGTHTRWALARAWGGERAGEMAGERAGERAGTEVLASGELPPMSGQQLADAQGRRQLAATLAELARAVAAATARLGIALPAALVAGITGFDAQAMPQWRALAAQALAMPEHQVRALSDIELACAAAFAPGQGVVLIAGTGSIAAHVDAQGRLHRAGGRGAVIDDAGSGHWIACQALQHIWRAEDLEPGSWQASPLARRVLGTMGGPEWAQTRQWVYGATRGELGTLAVAVAQAALGDSGGAADPAALGILQRAGQELARLVLALQQRVGPQPVALAGRVFELHPLVEASLRQALPAATALHRQQTPAHHAAACLAVRSVAVSVAVSAAVSAVSGVPPLWQR